MPIQGRFLANGVNIYNCKSSNTTILISESFEVSDSIVQYNIARYGGFASFMIGDKTNSETTKIKFNVVNVTATHNHAEIAGGKFFVFDPIVVTDFPETDNDNNTAGFYGPNLAGFTKTLDTQVLRYIYPEEVFNVTINRLDRFKNLVSREVIDKLDHSIIEARIEGGSTQGDAKFVGGIAIFDDSELTSHVLGAQPTIIFTAKEYPLVKPANLVIVISPVCPPGFKIVCAMEREGVW